LKVECTSSEAQADEEVLDGAAPACEDILADDPIAIFMSRISSPIQLAKDRVAVRARRRAVCSAIQAGSAARFWMKVDGLSFHSIRGLA